MDKQPVVNTFLKTVNTLRTSKCNQKEKLVLFHQIADCIISPSMQVNLQYTRHCSSAVSALLFFAEDHDSVVRMNAEENLNRIFRSMEKTRCSRILIDLFGEIKKNGNQKSLRICLNLFAYYCPRIKENNVKWYAVHLVSCVQAIAMRKETLLIETLCNFVKSYCEQLQSSLNDSETLKLIDTFLCTTTSECAVKRRCSSQNCINLIENSRNKRAMVKHGLNKAIDILLSNHQQVNTLLGIFGLLRLLMPIIIRDEVEKRHSDYLKQIVEIYDLCLHYLWNTNSVANHSIINASLEVINSILQSIELSGNALESLLCNHQLHHNEYLKKRKSLKNQIFELKTIEITTTCNTPNKISIDNKVNVKMAKPQLEAKMSIAIERQQQSQSQFQKQLQPQQRCHEKITQPKSNSDCESETEFVTETEANARAESSPCTSDLKKINIVCDLNKHKMSERKSTKETIKDAFKLEIQNSPTSMVDGYENNVLAGIPNQMAGIIENITAIRNCTKVKDVGIDADGFDNDDNDNDNDKVNNKNNIEMRVNVIHVEDDKNAENVTKDFTSNEEDGKQYNIRHSHDNSNDGNSDGNGNDDDVDVNVDVDGNGAGGGINPHLYTHTQQKGGTISGDNIIIDDDGFTTLLEINEPNEDDSLLLLQRSTSGSIIGSTVSIDDKSQFLSDIDNESFQSIDFESEVKIAEYTTNTNPIAVKPTTKTNSGSLDMQKLIATSSSSSSAITGAKDSFGAVKSTDTTVGSFFNNLLSHSGAETMSKLFRPSSSSSSLLSVKTPTLAISKNVPSDDIDIATELNPNRDNDSLSLQTRTKENLPNTSTPNQTKQKDIKQHAIAEDMDSFNQNEMLLGGIGCISGSGGDGGIGGIGSFADNISLDSINSYISMGSHFSTLTTNTTASQDLLMKNEQDLEIMVEQTSAKTEMTGDDVSETSVTTSSTILLDNTANKNAQCDQLIEEEDTLSLQLKSSPLVLSDKSHTKTEMTNISTTPRNTYNKNFDYDNISAFIKFNIGTIYDQAIIYYTVRFIAAKFLLTGKFGELQSDENIRVSIKNLSLNVIANCVRLMPEVLFLSIEMAENELIKQTNNEIILSDLGEEDDDYGKIVNNFNCKSNSSSSGSNGSLSNVGKDFDHLDIEREDYIHDDQPNPIQPAIEENLLEIKDDHFGKSTTDYFLNSPLSKSADTILMAELKRQTNVAKDTEKLNETFEKILSKSEILPSSNMKKSFNSPEKLLSLSKSSKKSEASSPLPSSPPTPPLPPRGIKPTHTMSASYKKLLTQFDNSSVEKNLNSKFQNKGNSYTDSCSPSAIPPIIPNRSSKTTTTTVQLNIDFNAGHDKNHRGQCIDDILLFYNCPDPILRGDVQIIIGNFIESRLMMMTTKAIQWNCDDICTRFDCCPLRISRLLAILIKGLQDDIHSVVIHSLTSFDKIFPLVMSKYLIDQSKQIIMPELRSSMGQNSTSTHLNEPTSTSSSSSLILQSTHNGYDDDWFIESLLNFQPNDDYKNKIDKNQQNEIYVGDIQRSNFISPKLLLDKLRICYHNKYWLVQNKYAEVISNLNYKTIREYYGNDICSSYESLFSEELLQLIGDDDFRVRDHIGNCLARYIIQMQQDNNLSHHQIILSNSLSTIPASYLSTINSFLTTMPEIDHINFNLIREFCDYRLFQSMSPYLNDLFNSNSVLPHKLTERLLAKFLYRITNKLLELNNKNGQIGLVSTLKTLTYTFNPVDYFSVWDEFNFVEICLNYLNSNSNFIVADLSAQNDLIELTAKLITANILRGNINSYNQYADNLFIHIMKILNIYYHLFGNHKPSLFVRAQKSDLFTNAKELAVINNIGYFGNDFVYIKFYNILNCAYESYKITINLESGSKLLSLLSTCINTLSLCIEMKAHTNFGNSVKIIEEILQYLTVLINYRTVECIGCLKQLLKFLFGQNYANRSNDYEKFTKLYFDVRQTMCMDVDNSENERLEAGSINSNYNNNKVNLNKIISDITITDSKTNSINDTEIEGYLAEKCDNGGSAENVESNECNKSPILNLRQPEKFNNAKFTENFVELLTSAMNFPIGATTNGDDCAKHIKLFQPLVMHCLTLFLKSNSRVKAPLLDLLSQLLELNVTYSELDSKNVLFEEVIKTVELIESGISRNAKYVIPSIIKFLVRLTHQNDIKLTTIPKIIGITNNLLANNSIRECSVVALKCLTLELFFIQPLPLLSMATTLPSNDSVSAGGGGRRISIITATIQNEIVQSENLKISPTTSTSTMHSLLNIKETNTQKEVVFGMLEKFIDSMECQSVLGILLLWSNNKFGYSGKVIQTPTTTPTTTTTKPIRTATGDLLLESPIVNDIDTGIIINEKPTMEKSTIQEGAIYSIVTKGLIEKRIKVNNWNEFFIVDAVFKNSHKNIRLDSKEFASMLTLFIEQDVENFNDLSYATIILDNVILKTEEIYLVNHIKLYLKNHYDKVAIAQIKDTTNTTRLCCDMTSIGHKFGNQYQRQQNLSTIPTINATTTSEIEIVAAAAASVEAATVASSELAAAKSEASSSNTNWKICSSFYDSFTSVPINEINYFAKVLYEKLDRCFAILIKSHPYNRKYCGLAVKFVSALNDISNKDVLSSVLRLALDKNDFWNKYKIYAISTGGSGGNGDLRYEYQRLYIEIFKLFAMLGLLNRTMMLQQIQMDDIKWNLRRTLVTEICIKFNNPDDWTLEEVECLFSRPFLNILINDNLPLMQNLCHRRKQYGCLLVNALIDNCDLLTLQTVLRIPSLLLNTNVMEKIPIELKIELLSKIFSKVDTNKILQKLIERTIRKIIASHPDEVTTMFSSPSSSTISTKLLLPSSTSSSILLKSPPPLLPLSTSSIGKMFMNLPKRNLELEMIIFGEHFGKRKQDDIDDGTTRQNFEQKIIEEKWLIGQIINFSSHANAQEFVHILLDIKSELKLRKIFRSSDINLCNILQPSIDISLKSMLSSFQNNCVQYNPHINYMNLNPLAKVSISILMTNIENLNNDSGNVNVSQQQNQCVNNIHNITYLASAVISLMENLKQIETTSLIYIEGKFIEKFIKDQILKPDIIAILMNFIRICCNLVKSICKSQYSNSSSAHLSSFLLKQQKPEKQQQEQEQEQEKEIFLQFPAAIESLPPTPPLMSSSLSSSSSSSISSLLKKSTTSPMTIPLVASENEKYKEANLLDLCTYFKLIDIILKQKFIWLELNQPDKQDTILNELLDILFIATTKSIQHSVFYKRHRIPINSSSNSNVTSQTNMNSESKTEETTIASTRKDRQNRCNEFGEPTIISTFTTPATTTTTTTLPAKENLEIFQKATFIGKLIEAKIGIDSVNSNNNTSANDDCSFLRTIPEASAPIPMKVLHSIGISVLRANKFYPYAVTPLEIFESTSASGSYQSQMRNANGKLPSIPVEHLSDVDVLQKFVKRLSIFGFTSRQQFEEYFMTFLLLINKVYDENMVDQQEQFQIKSTCLEAILELLITYKTFPIVGNKLSHFHHTTRWSRIKCDSISSKKLHKVHLLISNSNVFYHPNLERNLFLNNDDNIIGTHNFQSNQYDLNFIWQQMENHSINNNNSISSSSSISSQIADEKLSEMDVKRNRVIGSNANDRMKEDVGIKNFRFFSENSDIDFKSSAQLIFDILTQLIEHNGILVLPNLVKFCEICDSRDQVKWIKDKVYKLQEQIPIDDTISHQHIIYLMCKTQSILIPSLSELSYLCTIISLYLKSSHIFIRNGALHGLLSLLECCSKTNTTIGKLSKELSILRDLIVEYINRHGIIEESSIPYSDTHTKLIWTLNFSLIEWTTKFVPDCLLLSNTIISAHNLLKRTSNMNIYLCVLHGLERIIMINIAPQAMRNKIEKLALELVKMENETFSIPALKLLLSCMYMASSQQLENTELSNGIVQDDPEIIAQQSDKVDILLHCIKSSTWSAAWIYGQVLCQILRDLVPPKEILTKVIKEFLAINQPHCDVIARIVNQVFRSAIDSSFLQMLQDWLICSLPTFLSLPECKSVWCLTVIFLSSSINLHLIKLFPVVLYEFDKLGQQEISLFVTSAQDFYSKLNSDQRTRFIDSFNKCNHNTTFEILLKSL